MANNNVAYCNVKVAWADGATPPEGQIQADGVVVAPDGSFVNGSNGPTFGMSMRLPYDLSKHTIEQAIESALSDQGFTNTDIVILPL